jgi:FAD/FMN-containing dehydrogenase
MVSDHSSGLAGELREIVGAPNVITDRATLLSLCKDYSWFSPVVEAEVASWTPAELAVKPRSTQQVLAIASVARRREIPLTVRGGGTGNYGQALPRRGGILLLTSNLSRILGFGVADVRAEAGVRLGTLEKRAREHGLELRIYPSTYLTSSTAGFVAGGAGGVGSVAWGTLRDGNVLGAKLVTLEAPPRICEVSGADVTSIVHAFGTTGVLTEVTLPLAPATDWEQCVVACPSLSAAYRFGEEVCADDRVPKRLVSIHEWPIASMFTTLARAGAVAAEWTTVLLEIGAGSIERIATLAARSGGRVIWQSPPSAYHAPGAISLSDFSFNHTMLWARRSDPTYTYLQLGLNVGRELDQIQAMKEAFQQVLVHLEFMRFGRQLGTVALPLLRFESRSRLYEIMERCAKLGMRVIDPHTWLLSVDAQTNVSIGEAKRRHDPNNLLNPGKIKTPEYVL